MCINRSEEDGFFILEKIYLKCLKNYKPKILSITQLV
jgi:hypothetical protein